jgi:hypothetical protein
MLFNLSDKEELNSFVDSVLEDNDCENAKRIVRTFDLAYEKGLYSEQFIYSYPYKTGMPIWFLNGLCNTEARKDVFKTVSNKIRNKFNF